MAGMTRSLTLLAFAATLWASTSAFAQAVTPEPTPAPGSIAPTVAPTVAAPMAPTVPPITMVPAGQSNAAPQGIDLNAALGKLGGGNQQQKLGQVMAIGAILSCTQKTAGQEATQAFYQQMQQVGKSVEAQCKAGNVAQAKTIVLSTLQARQHDPVVKSMEGCYDTQGAQLAGLAGPKVATDAAHYARWLKDPALAQKEMRDEDVCRHSKG